MIVANYPTKPGYYYRNGRWYPSKETKRKQSKAYLIEEISEQIRLFPEKYPYQTLALSQAAARHHDFEVWWQKCKKGHLTERKVTEDSCPVCFRISRDIRNQRIKKAVVNLSREEEVQLYEIYCQSRKLTSETGMAHHVDHIRPLAAGGVHHPDNLQIITAKDNLSKGSLYKNRRAVYSKAEKKEAHAEFIRVKKANEERVRAALHEARLAKAAEQLDKERQTLASARWLLLGGIASAAIILYLLFRV